MDSIGGMRMRKQRRGDHRGGPRERVRLQVGRENAGWMEVSKGSEHKRQNIYCLKDRRFTRWYPMSVPPRLILPRREHACSSDLPMQTLHIKLPNHTRPISPCRFISINISV